MTRVACTAGVAGVTGVGVGAGAGVTALGVAGVAAEGAGAGVAVLVLTVVPADVDRTDAIEVAETEETRLIAGMMATA